jgi:hypothetical protein
VGKSFILYPEKRGGIMNSKKSIKKSGLKPVRNPLRKIKKAKKPSSHDMTQLLNFTQKIESSSSLLPWTT